MELTGTVRWQDIEGGFWGIDGDDERQYAPEDLPEAVAEDGARVKLTFQRSSRMSVRMWGIEIDLESIERLPNEPEEG